MLAQSYYKRRRRVRDGAELSTLEHLIASLHQRSNDNDLSNG